jgi:hypothetical protein
MPPPPIPSGGSMGSHMGSSMGSSTSSRPQSFSGSGRYRAGPPLQDWVGGNVEHEDIDARFDKLLVSWRRTRPKP